MKCALTLVLAVAACSRRAPITSCDDDLRGVYASGDERWMVIDSGDTLEAYPLFPDGEGPEPHGSAPADGAAGLGSPTPGASSGSEPADLVASPRVIDFKRASPTGLPGSTAPGVERSAARTVAGTAPVVGMAALAGTLRRRYLRRAERCDAHVPVHVTSCAGNTLELVLTDPSPPIELSPCTWPRPGPSRLVRWRRE
jgi:hypothetical protein